MEIIWQGLLQGGRLLAGGDPEVWEIALRSLAISGCSTLLGVLAGLPLGLWLALGRFPGRRLVQAGANLGMGLPPVVVGLGVSLLLWRSGPLGGWELMYTPAAMVLAQTLMAMPLVAALAMAAVLSLDGRLYWQLLSLGATRRQACWLLLREARLGLLAAVIAAFGRSISEVGASMMVGGNIKGATRVLTTATVLEVGKGEFDVALALGLVLLLLTYAVVALLTVLQHRGRRCEA